MASFCPKGSNFFVKCATAFINKNFFLDRLNTIDFDFRQVIIVLTQLEGSGGFSIAHRLTHRLSLHAGLYDWGPQGTLHMPNLDSKVDGLHAPRPL